MMDRRVGLLLVTLALGLASPVLADNVAGTDSILCAVATATQCVADGECTTGPAWMLNIPSFVEIDLKAQTMRTTEASGLNRTTEVKAPRPHGERVFLQGFQEGRAFSIAISKETGVFSFAVAMEGQTVTAIGECTPR